MRGFSFESFVLSDANREAFEAARRVAALEWDQPRPLVLWGGHGAGKSHLLWAIVKAVRASSQRAGLALVLAREFPQKVRDLADNPAPIQKGAPAILLVDELEDFDDTEDLERVVRVFLQEGHQAVLASHIHPDHLPQLSAGFRELLNEGVVIEIGSVAGAGMTPEQRLADAERQIETLAAERDALEARLAEKAAQAAEAPVLRAALSTAETELEALRLAHEELVRQQPDSPDYAPELSRLQETVTRLQADLAATAAERDRLEQRLAERAHLQRELDEARQELSEALSATSRAQEAAGIAEQEAARLANARDSLVQQLEALEAEKAALEAKALGLENDATEHQERLAQLLGEWENRQRQWRQTAEASLVQALGLVEQLLERDPGPHHEEALHALEHQLEMRRREYEAVQQALTDATRQHETTHLELDKARRQIALMAAEMDALRHEAAEQVARANFQAGELEGRIAACHERLRQGQSQTRAYGLALRDALEKLGQAFEPMDALAESLLETPLEDPAPEWDTFQPDPEPELESEWLEQQAFFFPAGEAPQEEAHKQDPETAPEENS